MSLQESVIPLQLRPHRSRWLAGFILFSHGGAILLALISLPLWAALLLSLGIAYSLVYTLNQHVLMRDPDTVSELIWDSNGDWRLIARNGTSINAQLLKSTYLHAKIVILNFVVNSRNRSIILLPDALDPDSFRRLRVRMQLEKFKTENRVE